MDHQPSTVVFESSKQATDSLIRRLVVRPFEYLNTLTALGALTVALVLAMPIAALLAARRALNRERAWRDTFRPLLRGYLWSAGIRLVVEGIDHVPDPTTPAVYAANHPSHLDGFIMDAVFGDRAATLMTAPYGHFPWPYPYWFRRMGAIEVTRNECEHRQFPTAYHGERAVRHAVTQIRRFKKSLFLFPEAHLERSQTVRPFKTGAVRIAVRAGVPLIPVSIRGSNRLLSPRHWLFHSGTITIVIHRPIDLTTMSLTDLGHPNLVDAHTYRLLRAIARNLPEDYHTPALREAVLRSGEDDPVAIVEQKEERGSARA
jgi:1-acyl-sn-glycerol-3-phosphate acyltransferase